MIFVNIGSLNKVKHILKKKHNDQSNWEKELIFFAKESSILGDLLDVKIGMDFSAVKFSEIS